MTWCYFHLASITDLFGNNWDVKLLKGFHFPLAISSGFMTWIFSMYCLLCFLICLGFLWCVMYPCFPSASLLLPSVAASWLLVLFANGFFLVYLELFSKFVWLMKKKLGFDTTKRLMSSPKCRSVEVINNPARPGSNHREVNCINYK